MITLMTSLAERDQVARSVASSLSALQVMDLQNRVFALAMTVLAFMSVAPEDILPHVPEVFLRTMLVVCPFRSRQTGLQGLDFTDAVLLTDL